MKTFKEFLNEAESKFEVVEYAGERDQEIVAKFKTKKEADDYIKKNYSKDDIKEMSVMLLIDGDYDKS